ncbi:MAG: chorismate lyase [Pseudomonadota bacterium]
MLPPTPHNASLPMQEPLWQSTAQHRLLSHGSAAAPDWLLDEGSLTEYLLKKSGGDFRVERLRQTWRRPLLSESALLGLPPDQWALVREVALHCFGEPWVYARSVMPAAALSGKLRRLRRLQNQSLGALLFKQPKLVREAFEIALLPGANRYIHDAVRQSGDAWARRSCFRLLGKRLLVSEVFLERFQG